MIKSCFYMRDSTIFVWKEAAPGCSQGGGLGGWDISLNELPTQRDKETKTEGSVFFLFWPFFVFWVPFTWSVHLNTKTKCNKINSKPECSPQLASMVSSETCPCCHTSSRQPQSQSPGPSKDQNYLTLLLNSLLAFQYLCTWSSAIPTSNLSQGRLVGLDRKMSSFILVIRKWCKQDRLILSFSTLQV